LLRDDNDTDPEKTLETEKSLKEDFPPPARGRVGVGGVFSR